MLPPLSPVSLLFLALALFSPPLRPLILFRIINAPLLFPQTPPVPWEASDLITALLQKQPSRRLGVIAGGVERIMGHPFFKGVDWAALSERRGSKGPIVPASEEAGAGLGKNFDEYPDEEMEDGDGYTDEMAKEYEREFDGF